MWSIYTLYCVKLQRIKHFSELKKDVTDEHAKVSGKSPRGLNPTQKTKDNREKLGAGQVGSCREHNWLFRAKCSALKHTYK